MNADYEARGITASTPRMGLALVGPNSLDSSTVLGQVHNAAMLSIDEKLSELEAKIDTLLAVLSLK
jgi:hypothetical protein